MVASWLSELWRQLTNSSKKNPEEILCQKLITKKIQVVGTKGIIEITAGEGGCKILMNHPDTKNMLSLFLKASGEINLDLIAGGAVKAALDMTPDGTLINRIPQVKPEGEE